MQNRWLFILVIVALLLGASLLTRGHDWGDDFASYIMQAKSILNGTTNEFMQHNSFTIFESSNQIGPVAYPWGYPLFLTPAYFLKGNHPLALKLPGLFFYAGFLVCLYLLMKSRLSETESLLITALFAVDPLLLVSLDQITSDIPFLCVSTLALWLMVSNGPERRLKHAALGLAMAAAFLIRTQGILLLASFLAMQSIRLWDQRADRAARLSIARHSLLVVSMFGFLWLVYAAVFPGGGESYFAQYQDFGLERTLAQAGSYLLAFREFFGNSLFWMAVYLVFALFFLIGAWDRRNEDLVLIIFFVLWMLVLSTWPSWQGARFLFPLLPLFICFTFAGMKFFLRRLPETSSRAGLSAYYGVWILIAIGFLYRSSSLAYVNLQNDRAINGPYDSFSREVYAYIKDETPADSVIVFFKPRAMRLMAERDSFLSTECDRILNGDYLVLSTKVGRNQQIPPEDIGACNLALHQVLENNRFVVYEIQK